MPKRRINKVAVIGSGIMGSGIACHFANIGVEVLLLDIIPFELNEKEKQQGLTMEDKVVRNRLVNDSLAQSVKSKPAPLYHKNFLDRITTGNLDDDISKVKDVDWIIEVVDGLAANGEEDNAAVEAKVKQEVTALCARFPMYPNL